MTSRIAHEMLGDLPLDALPVSVLLADGSLPDYPIIYANPAFEALTGYRSDELLGKNCRILQGPETDAATLAEVHDALHEKRPFQGMVLNYRKDGTSFWNELTISPIAVGDDPGRYFIGVQRDATSRLELESKLREAQKMEAVGKLAGGVAHDFNNLLAIVLAAAEELQDSLAEDDPRMRCIDDMIAATETGSNLVDRMLEFASSNPSNIAEVNANTTIEATVRLLQRSIREPIRFECDFSPSEVWIEVNRVSFETALMNMCVNSADAMPHGGVIRIRTRSRQSALPGVADAVEVMVSDTGSGMERAAIERAFEPFFTTKPRGVGTGLGLSTVYNFVKQAGGQVRIDSRKGHGTSVTMLLPQVRVSASQGDERDKVNHLLVVEDDPRLRSMLVRQLRAENFVVEEAASAEEALELLKERRLSLILSDIRLSGKMSGLDLHRQATRTGYPAPFVLMTGYTSGQDEIRRAGLEAEVLWKPFRKRDLLNAIDRVMRSVMGPR